MDDDVVAKVFVEEFGAKGEQVGARLARMEGVILDPVYTGKAFVRLLDLVERRQLGPGEPVIFLHTGGWPALFSQ